MRARIDQQALGLCVLIGQVAGFGTSIPTRVHGHLDHGLAANAAAKPRVLALGIRMRAARPLDAMTILTDESLKACPLRPTKSREQNAGLTTATFAMG